MGKIHKKVPKKAQKKHFFANNGYKMLFFYRWKGLPILIQLRRKKRI